MTQVPVTASPPPKMPRGAGEVTAIIAALIGLLALCVSAYTAYLQNQQVRAQVWPRLSLVSSNSRQSLLAINKGVGPAIVKSRRVYVDDVPQRDWRAAMGSLLGPDNLPELGQSSLSDMVVSTGEEIPLLHLEDAAAWKRLRPQLNRLRQRVCFCSTLDECWQIDQLAKRREEAYMAVDRCERHDSDEFHD
ncbi:hypothetical protein [Tahibacter amnicola]|uniref:Uncharacterized protein n=1 Tax=Tahibacter amnicola TaxID=2976241 RepID=A0ABY6BE04_9GAMM|nr:hypothetical protein [Tahibacter amnicola]UXI67340.1 hypothetical protein N4264_21780 [Tahibacter amnicola]